MKPLLLLVLTSALLSSCSQLGLEASGGATAAAGSDAALFRDIAQANLAEIAAGKLAVQKAQSPAVRQYGQDMVQAHTSLQTEGAQLAAAKGMSVPTSPDARHQAAMKKLESLSGASFDRAYMEQMLKDHADTLQLLERTASQAKDPALRAHAQKAMPEVRTHLELARRITGDVIGRAN